MKHLCFAALIALGTALVTPALAAECTPAIWDMENITYDADGTSASNPATSTRYCLADGAVRMDEFRALNDDGDPVFWGASFEAPIDAPGTTYILWIMVGDPGHTMIPAEYHEDGRQTTGGGGSDSIGTFLERAETTYDGAGGYHFDMDRSYDNGETWIDPFNVIDATLREEAPVPLPDALVPVIREGADALPADFPRGTPILDGTAEVRTFERDGQLILQFASRYWEPNRWRVAEWVVGTDQVSFTEVEF